MRRFWTTCLLVLLVALLPARGWAVAGMMVLPAGHTAAATAVALPCHGDAAAADEAAGAAEDTHTCASCDLCHTQLAASPSRLQAAALLRAHTPALLPARDTGRLLAATLERPPRG